MSGGVAKKKRPKSGRGQDAKGRSKTDRFVMLEHWVLGSEAWKSLTPQAVSILINLMRRYNGRNNGEISLSVREAATAVNINKDTAGRAFRELEEKGLIRRVTPGGFDYKLRHATEWELTMWPRRDGEVAAKDFMRWQPTKKAGPR